MSQLARFISLNRSGYCRRVKPSITEYEFHVEKVLGSVRALTETVIGTWRESPPSPTTLTLPA